MRLIKEYYEIGPGDVDQPAFPLFALFSAALGACSVIPDMDPTRPARVDPGKFVASIKKHQVTYSFGSPAIWNVVSRYCLAQGIVLRFPSESVDGRSAGTLANCCRGCKRYLPADAQVFTPYGATESLPIVSIEGREVVATDLAAEPAGAGAPVSVEPLPGIEIKIMDISDAPLAELTKEMLLA